MVCTKYIHCAYNGTQYFPCLEVWGEAAAKGFVSRPLRRGGVHCYVSHPTRGGGGDEKDFGWVLEEEDTGQPWLLKWP